MNPSGKHAINDLDVTFGREVLSVPSLFMDREWLLSNGLGGFASSTVGNCNTRRYHGLLVASVPPAGERLVLISQLEDTVEITVAGNKKYFSLDTHEYPGVLSPQGYLHQEDFCQSSYVQWTYALDGNRLHKRIMMEYGKNRTVVQYVNESDVRLSVTVRPLVTYRNFHHLRRRNDAWTWSETGTLNGVQLESNGWPFFVQASPNGAYTAEPRWYHDVQYAMERARGLDHAEDLYSPGYFRFEIGAGDSCMLSLSMEKEKELSFKRLVEKEDQRQEELWHRICKVSETAESKALLPLYHKLVLAADKFVVKKPDGRRTIMAGYPWFEDWGRDTFIALPGLLLVTGRFGEAKEILQGFADYVRNGIVPNYINPDGTASYNSIDASLWYIYALHAYVHYTADLKLVERLYPVLESIIKAYREGTAYSIKADWDELLTTGPDGAQLTWMDAKVGDRVMTPRWGKAVEINALWYNALSMMAGFEERLFGTKKYIDLAVRVQAAYVEMFWSEKNKYLFDLVQGEHKDATLRPNQLLSVSLPFKLLSDRQQKAVVDAVEKELLTPFGLRTLPVSDPRYHGAYQGGPLSRDEAYHQGTVWAWLMGPYIGAYLKVAKQSKIARQKVKQLLLNFEQHLTEAGLLSVSEIFDGDDPHTPRGTVAQAWSVGEILRVMYENLLQ